MVRLGYACINTTLHARGITTNRTCKLATFLKHNEPWNFLVAKGNQNLGDLAKIIQWNIDNKIFFFRISSSMFPHISNSQIEPVLGKATWQQYLNLEPFLEQLAHIKKLASKMRLTMHPDQFCQLASPKPHVVENAIRELEWHARFLDLVGNEESTICIHGGGNWDDKKAAVKRLIAVIRRLSPSVLKKLCLENCERSWSVEDLLPICKAVGIPLIFDFHHYKCWPHPQKPISELLPLIIETWKGRRPKFHLSDQDDDKRLGAHAMYVKKIPKELLGKKGYDLMIEAKGKELAVLKLREKYFSAPLQVPPPPSSH